VIARTLRSKEVLASIFMLPYFVLMLSHQLANIIISSDIYSTFRVRALIAMAAFAVEDLLEEADDIYVEDKDGTRMDARDNDNNSVATDMSDDHNNDVGAFKLSSF
jgi:hypothetical protein